MPKRMLFLLRHLLLEPSESKKQSKSKKHTRTVPFCNKTKKSKNKYCPQFMHLFLPWKKFHTHSNPTLSRIWTNLVLSLFYFWHSTPKKKNKQNEQSFAKKRIEGTNSLRVDWLLELYSLRNKFLFLSFGVVLCFLFFCIFFVCCSKSSVRDKTHKTKKFGERQDAQNKKEKKNQKEKKYKQKNSQQHQLDSQSVWQSLLPPNSQSEPNPIFVSALQKIREHSIPAFSNSELLCLLEKLEFVREPILTFCFCNFATRHQHSQLFGRNIVSLEHGRQSWFYSTWEHLFSSSEMAQNLETQILCSQSCCCKVVWVESFDRVADGVAASEIIIESYQFRINWCVWCLQCVYILTHETEEKNKGF